ncbi:hypothetical protein AVEN_275752-1 [Araneus ventricosus]|uniref:Uncharacterized protein n=1 Tax=Araneus ventricosus TaxID=182803 RepID=A0A4Y2HN96_ARAVE|nr:hypothetical protein AVEN_275752-1 [Araneus ventricosus]
MNLSPSRVCRRGLVVSAPPFNVPAYRIAVSNTRQDELEVSSHSISYKVSLPYQEVWRIPLDILQGPLPVLLQITQYLSPQVQAQVKLPAVRNIALVAQETFAVRTTRSFVLIARESLTVRMAHSFVLIARETFAVRMARSFVLISRETFAVRAARNFVLFVRESFLCGLLKKPLLWLLVKQYLDPHGEEKVVLTR